MYEEQRGDFTSTTSVLGWSLLRNEIFQATWTAQSSTFVATVANHPPVVAYDSLILISKKLAYNSGDESRKDRLRTFCWPKDCQVISL